MFASDIGTTGDPVIGTIVVSKVPKLAKAVGVTPGRPPCVYANVTGGSAEHACA